MKQALPLLAAGCRAWVAIFFVAASVLAQPVVSPPTTLAPNAYVPPSSPTPPIATSPQATLNGTIEPLHQSWDPYATQAPPPAVLPGESYVFQHHPAEVFQEPQKFFEEFVFEYTWLWADSGTDKQLGFNSFDISGTFAFPFFHSQSPLLVTPGMSFHLVDGPSTVGLAPPLPDLPPRLYDATLEIGWRPKVTEWLSGDLAFKTGVWSDFTFADSRSIRYLGRGVAIFAPTSNFQVALGVVYIDRVSIKLLPVAGVIWSPNVDSRWELVFPRPKISRRMTRIGNSDIWGYVLGEYGGGSWSITRASGAKDQFDYNDVRIAGGFEWMTTFDHKVFVEVGYVFNREVIYRSTPGNFDPDDTIMLRAGLHY